MITNSKLKSMTSLKIVSGLSLRKKVNFLGIFIILLFSVILFTRVLPLLEAGKLEERRGKLRAVVNTVVSLADHYEKGLRKNSWKENPAEPKSIEEAKAFIIKNLRQMRYDKTEYFFILDGQGKMILHPLKPELEGKYMMDTKGPQGDTIFRDLVINSQKDTETFVSYIWQSKYSPLIFEPQTSYAKYYWPWDWIICSGVYTQDILDSMKEINFLSAGYVVVTSMITILILFVFVYFNLSKPLLNILRGIEEIKKDNLNHKVDSYYNDELGYITHQFNEMIEHRKQSQEELLQLNSSLETKVIERTAELSETLNVVQNLKEKQDGDYFLTSLLLSPLQSLGTEEGINTRSEFFVQQYKKFTFRKWEAELGGDICITDTIELNGRSFLFFVNADAMGKSIQGAGGALIFGTSLKAALIRVKLGRSTSTQPESWLKNLYENLDELFTTFDGTMLISAVMGLLDQESGFLYFLNADHPHPVLYRDGKASFLKSKHQITKIGTPEKEYNQVQVYLFRLQNGDSFIAGSDGKDDIVLIEDGSINHDENLFLEIVEKGEGDIEKITKEIKIKGELKDDLSLFSIRFHKQKTFEMPTMTEDEKKILLKATTLHKNNQNPKALSLLKENFDNRHFYLPVFNLIKRIYLVEKDFAQYAKLIIRYHNLYPDNNDNLLKISKALVLGEQLEQAKEYAECLNLRDPDNEENTIHLARIYKLSNQNEKALEIIKEVLQRNPTQEEAIKLKENILSSEETNNVLPETNLEVGKFDY